MRKLALFICLFLLFAGYSLLAPVYQFYAHRGEVPMPPWGELTIPDNPPTFSQLKNPHYDQAAKQAMLELENHRQQINSPGISAAVAIDGQTVWAGGAGWADIAIAQPVTVNTQFRIGSTSKALTSTLLARLVQSGQIQLDMPLSQTKLAGLIPAWGDITPRQLASHMAGMPHYKHNTDWTGLYQTIALSQHYENVMDAVNLFDESDLLFQPGEDFSYSSLGTVLLSAVIQEQGEAPFQDLMHRQVFAPLGMTSTLHEPEDKTASPHLARFYWRADESQPVVRPWREVDLSHRLAGGGFISTPSDLVKLGLGFINKGFINESVRNTFWTAQRLNNGEINEQHYAIGWRVREFDHGEGIGVLMNANHGGVSKGSQSWLMVIPHFKMAVAVNINANTETFWDFGSVAMTLSRIFILDYKADEGPVFDKPGNAQVN